MNLNPTSTDPHCRDLGGMASLFSSLWWKFEAEGFTKDLNHPDCEGILQMIATFRRQLVQTTFHRHVASAMCQLFPNVPRGEKAQRYRWKETGRVVSAIKCCMLSCTNTARLFKAIEFEALQLERPPVLAGQSLVLKNVWGQATTSLSVPETLGSHNDVREMLRLGSGPETSVHPHQILVTETTHKRQVSIRTER